MSREAHRIRREGAETKNHSCGSRQGKRDAALCSTSEGLHLKGVSEKTRDLSQKPGGNAKTRVAQGEKRKGGGGGSKKKCKKSSASAEHDPGSLGEKT